MKIGIDASRANEPFRTGTEWYSYFVIEELKKIGKSDDQFVLYTKSALRDALSKLPSNFRSRILRWPPKFLWTQIRLAFEMLIRSPDLLFVPAHTVPIISPKKTVVTLHDIGFEFFAPLYSRRSIGPRHPFARAILAGLVRLLTLGKYGTSELDYHRWSSRLALRHAGKVITVSNFSKNEIVRHFRVAPENVVVTPLAYNPIYSKMDNTKEIAERLRRYSITNPYFLFIGRLEEKKNVSTMIDAFTRFKRETGAPHEFVLIGKPGYGYEAIQRAREQSGLAEKIRFTGWVPTEDLPYVMNGADGFIFVTNYEGFGMPILEAMACHVPVLTSSLTACPETAGGAAVLADPKNPQEIAEGMSKLVDPERRAALITAGAARAAQFSWEKTARETLHILKNA